MPRNQPATAAVIFNAVVNTVSFQATDTGYAILRCSDVLYGDVTVKGRFPPLAKGIRVVGTGDFKEHPKYGKELIVVEGRIEKPQDTDGIVKYLSSGIIDGCGIETAKKLVAAFGIDTLRVIRDEPHRMRDIEGVGDARAAAIADSSKKSQHIEQIMAWLMTYGCSTGLAFRIYEKYGDSAIDKLTSSPWALSDDVLGIGFKTADQIAARMGLGGTNPMRIQAGVNHCMRLVERAGHSAVPESKLLAELGNILRINSTDVFVDAMEAMIAGKELNRYGRKTPEPDDPHKRVVVLQRPRASGAEARIANRLTRIMRHPAVWPVASTLATIPSALEQTKFPADESQVEAIHNAMRSKVSILVGGPGSGKTSTCKAIIATLALSQPGIRIVGCAPTGAAADRITAQTGLKAMTIHRLVHAGRANQRTQRNPIDADFIIVDEMSLQSTVTMAMLLEAVPDYCGLLLVGDPDQLGSVGYGSVLADLIKSGLIPTAQLRKPHRQAEGSAIITNAYAIKEGRLKDIAAGADFQLFSTPDSSGLRDTIVALALHEMRTRGFQPKDIQVLTAGHRGPSGTIELNKLMQKTFNPTPSAFLSFGDTRFGVGDRVMVNENDNGLDVFNGQIGYVLAVLDENLIVDIRGEAKTFTRAHLPILQLAYCLTVHKCQGGEFPCVILAVDLAHYNLLDRNWLYTGVTRAKAHIALVAVPKAIGTAVRNVNPRKRVTLLVDRLQYASVNDPGPIPAAAQREASTSSSPSIRP